MRVACRRLPVRGGGLDQWNGGRHPDPEFAGFDQSGEIQSSRGADLGAGVGTESAPEDLEPKGEAAPEGGDGGDAVPVGHQRDGHVDRFVGTHRVDGRVNAFWSERTGSIEEAFAVEHRLGPSIRRYS